VSQAITEEYFKHRFKEIDWRMRKPPAFIISELARLADGLLIWAAMVCSFLSYDIAAGTPLERLEQIVSSGKRIALEGQEQLAELYDNALNRLFQTDKEQKLFQRVFGAMTVLQESLPLPDFARLLGMSDNEVKGVQTRCRALQTRGTFDERTVPPASERFHSSFMEFTMNRKAEPGNTLIPYLINPQTAHESIAEGCLTFLGQFLSSFRGSQCIHSNLRGLEIYTVAFWPLHVANSSDRSIPLLPKLESLLLAERNLRKWGSWFLAISLPDCTENWDEVVGQIDNDGFYCSLAGFLKNTKAMDTTLASRRTFCLEVAVRLEPRSAKAWEDLGKSYRGQFDRTGTLDLLNNAVIVYRRALELYSKDGNHLPCMFNLAYALWNRFRKTGSMTNLEEAISMLRESLSLCPAPHPGRPRVLTGLARALETEATSLRQEALAMSS
jgi:tetratricopeptide (TPR) repeat protein